MVPGGMAFFIYIILGYKIVVHSFQAQEPSGHQTSMAILLH